MISSKEHLTQEKSSNNCTVPFGSPTGPMPTTQQQQEVARNVDDYLAKKFAGEERQKTVAGRLLDPKSQFEAGSFPFFLDLVEKLRWFQSLLY